MSTNPLVGTRNRPPVPLPLSFNIHTDFDPEKIPLFFQTEWSSEPSATTLARKEEKVADRRLIFIGRRT